ncbi:MAG: hypothetical protein IJX63_11775 [Lachnospiraceae bacterium]|nr:hypothetical protein [Lachnospiraceae bacterium]
MTEKKSRMKTAVGEWVPQYIPNRMVSGIMGFLSLFKTAKRKVKENRENNYHLLVEKEYSKETRQFFTPGAYIENQAQWGKVCFGKKYTMAYGGCEIFAVYNALVALEQEPDGRALMDLISKFERKGAVLAGYLGSAPKAAYHYFRELGYQVKVVTRRDEAAINQLGEEYETVIATVYNDGHDIFRMIHTVNISKDEQGCYHGHNCYKRGKNAKGEMTYVSHGPHRTLWDAVSAMSGGTAEVLLVMGIR